VSRWTILFSAARVHTRAHDNEHMHPEGVVEQEQDGTGVTRGQNQLHVLPEDWRNAASVIEPLLDRLDPGTGVANTQLLLVVSDADAAAGIAAQLAGAVTQRGGGARIAAITDARRGARVLRAAPAHVVVGPPHALVELLQSAALKLDGVRAVVLAWVDELGAGATRALETLVAELPKDSARVVIAGAVTPAVEQLVERYARRARRTQTTTSEARPPASLSYVVVNETARVAALRRILDALDPESAFIVARDGDSNAQVQGVLLSLGYGADSPDFRVGSTPDGTPGLVVLFDLPTTEDELRTIAVVRGSARIVAIITPRQVATLRKMAGGSVAPLSLPEAAVRARTREEGLREELRGILEAGQFSRELLALEPLLSDYDGAEVAAAALRLLEADRTKALQPAAPAAPAPLTRLYLNVGTSDNVRPGDLVGAITNEAGISKADLGKVDVRDRHSTVEVATTVANAVVSKLTGVSIRGRRVVARVDEGPPANRERGDRPMRPRRDDARSGSRDRRPKR
jgi:ATP-dependent RNA helicase DeaD